MMMGTKTFEQAQSECANWIEKEIYNPGWQYPKSLLCQKTDAVWDCVKDFQKAKPDIALKFMNNKYIFSTMTALAWQWGFLPNNMINHLKTI